jgi:hypothetical protein
MPNGDESTIRLSKKAKKAILEMGSMADTYETVIMRAIEHYKKCHKKEVEKQ